MAVGPKSSKTGVYGGSGATKVLQIDHYGFMKRSIVEGGRGGGGGGPDLVFQGTLGQVFVYRTPYGKYEK